MNSIVIDCYISEFQYQTTEYAVYNSFNTISIPLVFYFNIFNPEYLVKNIQFNKEVRITGSLTNVNGKLVIHVRTFSLLK